MALQQLEALPWVATSASVKEVPAEEASAVTFWFVVDTMVNDVWLEVPGVTELFCTPIQAKPSTTAATRAVPIKIL